MATWIIIAFVLICLGMGIYPILQLAPNDRQKKVQKLRQAAFSKGYRVDVRTPDMPEQLSKQYNFAGHVLYRIESVNLPTRSILAIKSSSSGEWFWVNTQPPVALMDALKTLYQSLPENIKAVEHNAMGSGVYWNEFGDEALLDNYQSVLQEMNLLFIQAA